MDKAPNAPRLTRAFLVIAIVALLLAGLGGMFIHRHATGPSTTVRSPVSVPVTAPPTTLLYGARPGPNGTKILTETVDPLTLAVPTSWISASTDQLGLPDELDRVAAQAPALAAWLKVQRRAAVESAIRLFAYQPSAPHSYVSVISQSSPGVAPFTAAAVSALAASANKQKTPNVVVSGAQLPVGQVLKTDSSQVVQKQRVVVEDLVLVVAGRTLLVEMAAETATAVTPAVFGEIAQSLSLS